MIGMLRGVVWRGDDDARVIVDVNGVGYEVFVDRQSLLEIAEDGEVATLTIRTVVREDSITLFGFSSKVGRDVFDLLTAVSGIGPRLAEAILGGMPLADLVQAVREKDIRRLSQISGIGKKTAERLTMELAEKFFSLPLEAPAAPKGISSAMIDDLKSALANLGYHPRDVDVALRALPESGGRTDFEDLFRLALAALTRPKS